MAFLVLGANSVSGYTVKNSLRFNSASSDYLNRTPATTTNRRTWTWSGWVKRSTISGTQVLFGHNNYPTLQTSIRFTNDNTFSLAGTGFSGTDESVTSNQVFRDVSAWYHLVVAVDTTQATSSNRVKLYSNGVEITSLQYNAYPTLNLDTAINYSSAINYIGATNTPTANANLYMAEVNLIDGQALTPSSFGETDTDTGIWKPKAYTGTYGTNGFYLKFANSASLGTDSSGNGNTFTVNNLTSVDQTTDTPTNNFATLNPLNSVGTGANPTYSEGNTKVVSSADNYFGGSNSIGVTTGKWYLEVKLDAQSSSGLGVIGMSTNIFEESRQNRHFGQLTSNPSVGYYGSSGNKAIDGGTSSAYGNSYTAGDIIGIAIDLTNNYIYFSKNGTFQNSGVPTSGSSGTGGIALTSTTREWFLSLGDGGSTDTATYSINTGNPNYSANSYTDGAGYGNFSYSVPSGYYSLCTKNLATFG